LSQKRQFLADFIGENILKIITPVPEQTVHKNWKGYDFKDGDHQ
jgi:hypothetical protein